MTAALRYVGWREKAMRSQVGAYKLTSSRRGYEVTPCAECGKPTLHQPANSEGCRIVCWECS